MYGITCTSCEPSSKDLREVHLYAKTFLLCVHRAPTRLEMAGWGSEPAGGEGHGGCYDNFVMVFDRCVCTRMLLTLYNYMYAHT